MNDIELEFGVLVLVKGGKLVNLEKNLRNLDDYQQHKLNVVVTPPIQSGTGG